MERIGHSTEEQLAPQSRDSRGTGLALRPRLDSVTENTLAMLTAQTAALFSHQELDPITAQMYATEWTDMVLTFGLEMFQACLIRANRASRFFPHPIDIRERCEEARRDAADRRATQRVLDEQDAFRRHRAEHPEDYAETPEMRAQMDRINERLGSSRPERTVSARNVECRTPWERCGMTEVEYEAECERKRALVEAAKAEVAA